MNYLCEYKVSHKGKEKTGKLEMRGIMRVQESLGFAGFLPLISALENFNFKVTYALISEGIEGSKPEEFYDNEDIDIVELTSMFLAGIASLFSKGKKKKPSKK